MGFGSILAAIALSVVAWNMPGKLFQAGPPEEKLPTIVVLPLVDMSVDQNEQALCDGLTEELSNWLAHIPTLRVVARTSAFAFKGTNTDVREIGRQLNATHVLEGSLRRSGNEMRITVQLIEATGGLHIWSRTFDLPLGDIFLIEDTVSRSVAEQLHLTLSATTAEQWAQRQPEKMEAYELYLLGRARQRKRTADDNLKAAEFFRRAVAADPQYALAQVGLAETLLNGLSLNRAPLEDVSAEAEPLINRALALNPELPDALAVKGWLLTEEFRLDEALPLLQRATKANPNDASSHRFLGNLYDRRADPNSALSRFSVAASSIRSISSRMCSAARNSSTSASWSTPRNPASGPASSSRTTCGGRSPRPGSRAPRVIPTAPFAGSKRRVSSRPPMVGRRPDDRAAADAEEDEEAHELLPELPGAGVSRLVTRSQRGAGGEWRRGTAQAGWPNTTSPDTAVTGAELIELARLQYLAGDAVAARATLAHAQRILPLSSADLFDGSQIRHDYSAALFHAGIELQGGGDAARATNCCGSSTRCSPPTKRMVASTTGCISCGPPRWRCREKRRRPRLRWTTPGSVAGARRGARAAIPFSGS